MARKVHLHNRCVIDSLILICCFFFSSCNHRDQGKVVFTPLDLTKIPHDTLDVSKLAAQNGVLFYQGREFSGYVTEYYLGGVRSRITSYLAGKLHGFSRTYYPNGWPRDIRSYRQNLCYGHHLGYWENGKPKFHYFYIDEKREGIQKQWYKTGAPARFLNYQDDKEDGMQRAWRENGKLYVNYEVRNGIRYGLQKSALCYTVKSKKR